MSLKRIAIPSPNYSSRQGAQVRLIVLHTAEGAKTYQSLGAYFQNPASGVSSHVGIDDTPGTIGEYVQRSGKAWTAANANPVAIQVELCAWATWKLAEWNKHSQMLENCARWIAEEAAYFHIPIVALTPQAAQSGGKGVCQHNDLGSWGGGHWDCGSGFPMGDVLDIARGTKTGTAPPPKPPQSGGDAPKFPLPYGHYYGIPDGSGHWHDGHGQGKDSKNIQTWQQKMSDRGWVIGVDGQYGSQSKAVCQQFQAEKHLVADGKCGPKTWTMTWEAPQ